jgi:hypothetical protein
VIHSNTVRYPRRPATQQHDLFTEMRMRANVIDALQQHVQVLRMCSPDEYALAGLANNNSRCADPSLRFDHGYT